MRSLLRGITPPFILSAYRSMTARVVRYEGPYSNWQEAERRASGYDRVEIFEAVRDASRKVRDGAAAFERDSVAFDRLEYSFPLLAFLLQVAMRRGEPLRVLDFGGALGSSYYQARSFLAPAVKLRWCVVEQKAFVDCGRQEFQNEQLCFYPSIAECIAQESPNVALLSSVLAYVEEPYAILAEIVAAGLKDIIIDRTQYHDGDEDLCFVQHVPPRVYPANYPCRVFGRGNIAAALNPHYSQVASFDALDGPVPAKRMTIRFGGSMWSKS